MAPTFLLVEDDACTAELVRRALDRAGVDARLVVERSGDDAVSRLLAWGEAGTPPAGVLADRRPQGAGGLEVLAMVRSTPAISKCPVVIYTGSLRAADKEEALAAGADGFFVKPEDFSVLVERMRELGAKWLQGVPDSKDSWPPRRAEDAIVA